MGGHFDDPQSCAGGTLTLLADQGHDIVGLSITGGPPPAPGANPEDRSVKNRLNAMRMAEILKIRLECLDYAGSNSGQFSPSIVYATGCEVSGQRYKEFTELLLDKYKPDLVFTHWPIDFHMDHRAASLLTYEAWLRGGKKFCALLHGSGTGDPDAGLLRHALRGHYLRGGAHARGMEGRHLVVRRLLASP